jgi:hypothetical protein
VLAGLLLARPAVAQPVIDFEVVPGGAPADQLAIDSQYLADFGVSFSLEAGGTPFLEAVGTSDSGHGFWNAAFSTYDIEATGFAGQLGDYFLRFGTTTFSPTPGPVLVIDYATPVSAASAEIWDVDAASSGTNGYEQWTVTARDAVGGTLETIVSPMGIDESTAPSLNGKPWLWSFSRPSADIHSITLQFTGTASVVGLAFDNFSPSDPAGQAVPMPWLAALALVPALVGAAAVALRRRSEGMS